MTSHRVYLDFVKVPSFSVLAKQEIPIN